MRRYAVRRGGEHVAPPSGRFAARLPRRRAGGGRFVFADAEQKSISGKPLSSYDSVLKAAGDDERAHLPPCLYRAISRMASFDSCLRLDEARC